MKDSNDKFDGKHAEAGTDKRRTPDWALDPFKEWVSQNERLSIDLNCFWNLLVCPAL
jgi:hypothetical protein